MGVFLAEGPDGNTDGSYQFSGKQKSYINFSNDGILNVKHSITLLCWLNTTTASGSVPFLKYNRADYGDVQLKINDGFLVAQYKNKKQLTTNQSMAPNQWHYVGLSYEHNTGIVSLWVNGTRVKKKTIRADITLAAEHHIIIMGAENFEGRITAMQVYDVALTEEQINAVKYAGRGMNVIYIFNLRYLLALKTVNKAREVYFSHTYRKNSFHRRYAPTQ